MRFGRRFKPRRGNRRLRIKRAKRLRTFRNEKRKLGLAGQIIYAGLPERKKMFLTSAIQDLKFYVVKDKSGKITNSFTTSTISLCPKYTVEWDTLLTKNIPNWDKLAVSRIYIKIMPTSNSYTVGNIVPQFSGYYVIGDTEENSKKYSGVKQLINFDGSKAFTVLLEKPSVCTQYGATIYRTGTYLSLARLNGIAQPAKTMEEEEDTNYREGRYNQPPQDSEEYVSEEEGEEVWGDEQYEGIKNHYGNFVIQLENPLPIEDNAITLRYKVFYKVHLRG